MLQALGNIFQIPELRQKIVFTLIMFAVFRMGTHIPVPGVDPTAIEQLFAQGTLFGLLDLFSGGAFSKFSVFAMSITPYINAAIIIQLLNGRRKARRGTRRRRRSHAILRLRSHSFRRSVCRSV